MNAIGIMHSGTCFYQQNYALPLQFAGMIALLVMQHGVGWAQRGTLGYMAPESLQFGQRTSFAVDIFSYGKLMRTSFAVDIFSYGRLMLRMVSSCQLYEGAQLEQWR